MVSSSFIVVSVFLPMAAFGLMGRYRARAPNGAAQGIISYHRLIVSSSFIVSSSHRFIVSSFHRFIVSSSNYLIFNVTIANTARIILTTMNRCTIFDS